MTPKGPPSDKDEPDALSPESHDQPKSTPIEEFEEAVRLILGESAKPMQRGPLLSSLERLGIVIVSNNPANAMATRLSRMDDVVNVKGEGYWLQGKVDPKDTNGDDPDEDDAELLV